MAEVWRRYLFKLLLHKALEVGGTGLEQGDNVKANLGALPNALRSALQSAADRPDTDRLAEVAERLTEELDGLPDEQWRALLTRLTNRGRKAE